MVGASSIWMLKSLMQYIRDKKTIDDVASFVGVEEEVVRTRVEVMKKKGILGLRQ